MLICVLNILKKLKKDIIKQLLKKSNSYLKIKYVFNVFFKNISKIKNDIIKENLKKLNI